MALTDTDRRRFFAATVLSLLALPALWWANTSESSSAPNLAVAGLDADVDVRVDESAFDTDTPLGPITGEVAPVFLEGPASAAGAGQSEIAVPAKPLVAGIMADATFRSTVETDRCIVPGLSSGERITVVNLDNNRSITCTTALAPVTTGDVVLHTSAFASIADLTDAPIPVEIRR
jgi:hypothetical protein